jgi:hypothetical protein
MNIAQKPTRSRMQVVLVAFVAAGGLVAARCGGGAIGTGTGGPTGGGAGGRGATGMAGRGGPGTPGAGGTSGIGGGSAVTGASGSTGVGTGGAGGTTGVYACVPGVQQAIITDCGYPYASTNPLTSTVFNESGVLRSILPSGTWPNGVVSVFYNDEHALTLGVRSVVVKDANGTTTTDYPVSALPSDPGTVINPQTGTTLLSGLQNGLDPSLRPMWPVLFVTDVTADPNSKIGDWQQGGRPITPSAIFGTWKAAVRTVDTTVSPATTTITPDADPAKNNWNLGGGDPVPSGLSNEGYGAEARWNVTLTPGRSYRIQAIVHDGDQNKVGGDSGEACVLFCTGGSCPVEGCGPGDCISNETCEDGGTGTSCPEGFPACGPGGIDPTSCPTNTVCANGCCLSIDL